jgi:hypothetical protein
VAIESAAKFDCMIQAKVRKLPWRTLLLLRKSMKNVTVVDEVLGATSTFLVGASRLGLLAKPVWCPSNIPINMSLFLEDLASKNPSSRNFNLLVKFTTAKHVMSFGDGIWNFACETI